VEIPSEGVFDLAKNPPDALVAGAVAKVTPGTGIVGVAGTAAIGWVVQAAATGSTTARVKLTPSVASTPTVLAGKTPAAANRKSA
jgi:predicted RecA/RadA family phage recombinase